jgi:predicted nucleic acid-binding protein
MVEVVVDPLSLPERAVPVTDGAQDGAKIRCITDLAARPCSRMRIRVFAGPTSGRPITAADAWVAARALQWDLAPVTADYHSFEHLDGLTLIPVLP